jgi:hypothetical protein
MVYDNDGPIYSMLNGKPGLTECTGSNVTVSGGPAGSSGCYSGNGGSSLTFSNQDENNNQYWYMYWEDENCTNLILYELISITGWTYANYLSVNANFTNSNCNVFAGTVGSLTFTCGC